MNEVRCIIAGILVGIRLALIDKGNKGGLEKPTYKGPKPPKRR